MKRLSKTAGIYTIINTISNNRYVGSSVNLFNRQNMHMWSLKVNRHKNPHLQASYNKYGKDAFIFETLEECDVENLIQSEQYYVNNLKPKYNVHTECVKSCLGVKRSPEYIENISKRNTGNVWSQDRKEAFSKLAKDRNWIPPVGNKRVASFDFDGNIIKEYNSIKELCIDLNIHHTKVINICKGRKQPNTKLNITFKYI